MVEEMSKQHQAKAGAGGVQSLIVLKTETSDSDEGGPSAQLPGTEGAKREPSDSGGGGTLGPGAPRDAQGPKVSWDLPFLSKCLSFDHQPGLGT